MKHGVIAGSCDPTEGNCQESIPVVIDLFVVTGIPSSSNRPLVAFEVASKLSSYYYCSACTIGERLNSKPANPTLHVISTFTRSASLNKDYRYIMILMIASKAALHISPSNISQQLVLILIMLWSRSVLLLSAPFLVCVLTVASK